MAEPTTVAVGEPAPRTSRHFDAALMEEIDTNSPQAAPILPRWERKQLTGVPISARSSHAAALVDKHLWIYGGYGGEARKRDTCSEFFTVELSGEKPLEVVQSTPLDRPEKRVGHSMVPIFNNLYVFGGWDGKKYLNYGCLFDIEAGHLLLEKHKGRNTPEPRRDHTIVLMGRKLILFGGWNVLEQFNDVWVLDKYKWKWHKQDHTVQGLAPCPRRGHSACRVGKKMYVFGGIFGFSKFLDDLYVLDTETMEWSMPDTTGEAPSCRAWHTAVTVGNSGQILIFGGSAGRINFYNDAYVLDTAKMHWFRLPCLGAQVAKPATTVSSDDESAGFPQGRCSHTSTMVGSKMYVFGGLAPSPVDNKVTPLNDLWVLETGLQVDPAEDEPEDDDEDEAEDGETGQLNVGGSAFQGKVIATPSAATMHAGKDGDEGVLVEGWLAVHVKTEKEDFWQRRFCKVNGTDLVTLNYLEKGHVVLVDALVKLWSEKKHSCEDAESAPKDASQLSLEEILSDPGHASSKHFLEYCKSVFSEENAHFYLEIEAFKKLPESSAEQTQAAKDIFDKFLSHSATMGIDITPQQREQYTNDIASNRVNSMLFDVAQKRVLHTMRVDLMPKYTELVMVQAASKVNGPKFTVKYALTEADKTVPACENCGQKFNFHRRRNWCRLCGEVFCSSCVSHQVRLPPKYQVVELVRVCDMCNGWLSGMKYTFSIVSKRRRHPLNLAAANEKGLRKWLTAFNQALQLESSVDKSQAFSVAATATPETGPADGPTSMNSAGAEIGSAQSPTGASRSTLTPGNTLHVEGWLLKEDPSTKKYRKRYFVLHHNQLFYYQLTPVPGELLYLVRGNVDVISQVEPVLREPRGRGNTDEEARNVAPYLKGGFRVGSGFSYRFNVTSGPTVGSSVITLKLAGDTEQERLQWIDSVQKIIDSKPPSHPPVVRERPKPPPINTAVAIDDLKADVVSVVSPSSPLTPSTPHAQKAPVGEVAFVCALVEGSKTLWDDAPELTDGALRHAQEILSSLSATYDAYKVKSQLDSVSFAFHNVRSAVLWAAAVQTALVESEWSPELANLAHTKREVDATMQQVIFNGVRLKMAVHLGAPKYRVDPVSGRMEYSGSCVNQCTSLCEAAHGGQIVCSEEVVQAYDVGREADKDAEKESEDDEDKDDDDGDDKEELGEQEHPQPTKDEAPAPVALSFKELGLHIVGGSESAAGRDGTSPTAEWRARLFEVVPKRLEQRHFPILPLFKPTLTPLLDINAAASATVPAAADSP